MREHGAALQGAGRGDGREWGSGWTLEDASTGTQGQGDESNKSSYTTDNTKRTL